MKLQTSILISAAVSLALTVKIMHQRSTEAKQQHQAVKTELDKIKTVNLAQIRNNSDQLACNPEIVTELTQLNAKNRAYYFDLLQKPTTLQYFDSQLKKYNFGSCGPRGFLGSFTPHLMLEKDLEDYYDQPAIVFSSYLTVIQSALSAFAVDLVIVFDNSSFGIERLRESNRVLQIDYDAFIKEEFTESQTNLIKSNTILKFLAFDSEDQITNEIRDIGRILNIADKYKLRTLMNEKFLQHGSHLRGSCQQYTETTDIVVRNKDIDLITTSFEQSFGIPGGCCSGSMLYIGNMRTNALGYCFSASQPPALCGILRFLMRDVLEGLKEQTKADVKEV